MKWISAELLGISVQALEADKKNLRGLLIAVGQGARSYSSLWVHNPFVSRVRKARKLAAMLNGSLPQGGRVHAGAEYHVNYITVLTHWVWITAGWGRPDCWLRRFKQQYQQLKSLRPDKGVVVTDCRLPNEAKFLRKMDFEGARLCISEAVAKTRLFKRDGTTEFSFLRTETERHANHLEVDCIIDATEPLETVCKDVTEWLVLE